MNNGGGGDDVMDECAAAMVLMSLSCSPHSPHWDNGKMIHEIFYLPPCLFMLLACALPL